MLSRKYLDKPPQTFGPELLTLYAFVPFVVKLILWIGVIGVRMRASRARR